MNLSLVSKSCLFAVIATAANLASQAASLHVYSGTYDLWLAIFIGTAVGLAVKYLLDKRWIFAYETENLRDDAEKFALYTLMGVITTLIFWGSEILFDLLWQIPEAKYIGAIIGLSIGYVTKYQLDKRFVFKST
jgi:putative flippase GtrA